MCFFDHSFAHIFFVFHFVVKPMLEFQENMIFFGMVLKSSNYNYLSRRKVLCLHFVTAAELACFHDFCRHLLTNPVR